MRTTEAAERERLKRALIEHQGDTRLTAQALGMNPRQLRAIVRSSPELEDFALELMEQALDDAIEKIVDAMDHEDTEVRLGAARIMLRYADAARRRGFR
jgi:hypothetical protein